MFSGGQRYRVATDHLWRYQPSSAVAVACSVLHLAFTVGPVTDAPPTTTQSPLRLPYVRHSTVLVGAGPATVVDPSILECLDERAKAVGYAVTRGMLAFNFLLRRLLLATGGSVPVGVAQSRELFRLAHVCVTASSPYATGPRLAFQPQVVDAWSDTLAFLEECVPISLQWQAILRNGLGNASGVLAESADLLVRVSLSNMCGDPLRSAVRHHLRTSCAVRDEDAVVDALLDCPAPGSLSHADSLRFQHPMHTDAAGWSAGQLLESYYKARDPRALSVRRGGAASSMKRDAEGGGSEDASDAALTARVLEGLSIRWQILKGCLTGAHSLLCPPCVTSLGLLCPRSVGAGCRNFTCSLCGGPECIGHCIHRESSRRCKLRPHGANAGWRRRRCIKFCQREWKFKFKLLR